jgi:hypothetical protein
MGLDEGWLRAIAIVEESGSWSGNPNIHKALVTWQRSLLAGLKIGYKHYKDGPGTPKLVLPEEVLMGHRSCDCGHQDGATVVILTALNQMEERLMATIDEFEANLGTTLTELTKDVQRALDIITAGTLSDAQAAAAQAIQTGISNLDAAVEAVAPEPVTPPTPEPTPAPGTPPTA